MSNSAEYIQQSEAVELTTPTEMLLKDIMVTLKQIRSEVVLHNTNTAKLIALLEGWQ